MSAPRHSLTLRVLEPPFAVVRLSPESPIPEWAEGGSFTSVTRTSDELSIVVESRRVPTSRPDGARVSDDWRMLVVQGPIDFTVIGVTRDLVIPLADARISILPIATFDTDYLLVPGAQLDVAIAALRSAGHEVTLPIREP